MANAFARVYHFGFLKGIREQKKALPTKEVLSKIIRIIKDSDSCCNKTTEYYINQIEKNWEDESNR